MNNGVSVRKGSHVTKYSRGNCTIRKVEIDGDLIGFSAEHEEQLVGKCPSFEIDEKLNVKYINFSGVTVIGRNIDPIVRNIHEMLKFIDDVKELIESEKSNG